MGIIIMLIGAIIFKILDPIINKKAIIDANKKEPYKYKYDRKNNDLV
jgi:hypothetical protein